jgi:vacuolar-type H+-ATPase subunit F/Vma7
MLLGILMDVMIVGDKYLTTLFRLIGIETREAENEDSAVAKAQEIIETGECKVLFVSERIAMRLKNMRENLLNERKVYPILVVIPGFEGVLGERKKELTQLVNRSIGIKLKVGG